jgi:hypothetical protein
MRKSELSDLLNLLIFFLFPGTLVVLRIFDSYAYGLILILFFTFLKNSIQHNLKFSKTFLKVTIVCFLLLVTQLINHFFYIRSDILKTTYIAIALPLIYDFCEKFYLKIVKNYSIKNFNKIIQISTILILIAVILGVFYYSRVNNLAEEASSLYRLFFFNEPSHVVTIVGPILVAFIYTNKKINLITLKLLIISVIIFSLGSATGAIFLILLYFSTYKVSRISILFIFLFTIILILNFFQIDKINYLFYLYTDRLESLFIAFRSDNYFNLNLSTVIFLQAYEFIWDTIVRVDLLGLGSGNGFYHIIDYPAFNYNLWLHGDARLNVTDGSLFISKLTLEYGLIFASLYLFFIYKFTKYFFLIRNRIINLEYDLLDYIYLGCYITLIINVFFRGGGFLHHSMFYFFLTLIIYLNKNEKK